MLCSISPQGLRFVFRLCGLLALWPVCGRTDVTLGAPFGDHMVLQRDRPIAVWGQADAGEAVEVTLGDDSVRAVAGPQGNWILHLPAREASAIPTELLIQGHNKLTIRDVVIGDVWLCSGQSNMAFEVDRAFYAEEEILAARYPLIRHALVPRRVADEMQSEAEIEWEVCSPQTAGDFSAVGYYFARAQHLRDGVPVGLINSTWGGSPVQSWMSDETLRKDPHYAATMQRWEKRLSDYPIKQADYLEKLEAWKQRQQVAFANDEPFTERVPRRAEGRGSKWQPSGLYNAMIHPLVPMTMRGALWYQGEANAPQAEEYASLFKGMIQQWRRDFDAELPFLFVQLANYDRWFDETHLTWAHLREAQAAALELPLTGMAVTIDIGEVDDVHPRNKQDVGRRLAVIARALLAGSDEVYQGPSFRDVQLDAATLRVRFDHADGLTTGGGEVLSFEVAGVDQQFHEATAVIDGDAVVVQSEMVPEPVAVRYAWHNFPDARLRNAAGLPAVPFRSHPW